MKPEIQALFDSPDPLPRGTYELDTHGITVWQGTHTVYAVHPFGDPSVKYWGAKPLAQTTSKEAALAAVRLLAL